MPLQPINTNHCRKIPNKLIGTFPCFASKIIHTFAYNITQIPFHNGFTLLYKNDFLEKLLGFVTKQTTCVSKPTIIAMQPVIGVNKAAGFTNQITTFDMVATGFVIKPSGFVTKPLGLMLQPLGLINQIEASTVKTIGFFNTNPPLYTTAQFATSK